MCRNLTQYYDVTFTEKYKLTAFSEYKCVSKITNKDLFEVNILSVSLPSQ